MLKVIALGALLPACLFAQADFQSQRVLPDDLTGPVSAPSTAKDPSAREASSALPRSVFTSSDDRMNGTPTEWYVYSGQSLQQVIDTYSNNGLRLVDLYVENTNPYTFAAVYVKNTGAYAKTWWWYVGIDAAGLSANLSSNNARLISLKAYDIGSGQIRFAAIMIPNTGADAKSWWWYYGQNVAQLTSLWQANNARIVQINSYVSGGQTYYAAIMISNTGADAKSWWWYVNQTPANLAALVNTNNARIIDLDYIPATGNYNAAMVSCSGGCPNWWWYVGVTAQQLLDFVAQNGARIIDINTYPGCGGACYSFAMIDNSNDITSRVGQLLRSGTDGVRGLYLKQVGGPVLANLQENFVFEPASSIKVVSHLYALQQVQAGARALTDSIVHYNPPVSGSCPDPATTNGTETLGTALQEMMWHSDNTRTREIDDTFGYTNINNNAHTYGMPNTNINHIIGCGGPIPNQLTLADAGHLYEGVANASFLDIPNRNTFYSLMAGKSQFLAEGYDWTGLWSTDIPNIITQEAPAGMTLGQRQAYQNQMNLAYKAGNYTICQDVACTSKKEYISIAGVAHLPFCSAGAATYRDYVFGIYLHAVTDVNAASTAFNNSKAELLREQLRDGLASCTSMTTVDVAIGTSPAGRTFSVDGITYTSAQTFSWYPGEQHDVSTPTPQQGSGVRYPFDHWSDGLPRSHTFTVPSSSTAITASFLSQYQLTLISAPAASAGAILSSPTSAGGYYDAGAVVKLTPVPNTGYRFVSWSGDLTGTTQPLNITMSAPRSVTATFAAITYPDLGLTKTHSGSFTLGANGVFTVSLHNYGPLPTTGGITVTDTLPPGLTFVSGIGTGWGCSAIGQNVTCLNAGPISSNGTTSFLLTVNVGALAYPGVTNTATVSNASDGNPANDSATDSATVVRPPLRFVAVTPCRVADTRLAAGPFGAPVMAGGSTRSFNIPQSTCAIPASAQAFSLNVTVVPRGGLGYLTLWPAGLSQPLVSTLNSYGGDVVANAAIVPAGASGAVSVFVTNDTDVILDINGYFDAATGASFYSDMPCRVADTRNAAGPFGGPVMSAGQTRNFSIPSSACSIPANATAYAMNYTVVPAGFLGYLSTWPAGQGMPVVSTLNSWKGKVLANAALVPAGTSGGVSVYTSDSTHLVLDINGHFGPTGGSGELKFYPVTPCRVADTRTTAGPFGGPILSAASTRSFAVQQSGCGIPATAKAYSVNITVVPSAGLSYLTAWPTGNTQPYVSTLNSWDGSVVANAAIIPAGTNGSISFYVTDATHLVLDINGYFN